MILILGRSGSGKDHLARELSKYGLTQVLSYTTRPPRRPDENTHIFIKPEESGNYKEKIAPTWNDGYVYFATKQQVMDNDIYIVDPNGLYELLRKFPDMSFTVVYVYADMQDRFNRALDRVSRDDKALREQAAKVFRSRHESEDKRFADFEKEYVISGSGELSDRFPNVTEFKCYHNDYRPETVNKVVEELIKHYAWRSAS